MGEEERFYEWLRFGRKITQEEYEVYSGLLEECHEIEIDKLDHEEEHGLLMLEPSTKCAHGG